MTYWLAVVQRDHVLRGVELGIVQRWSGRASRRGQVEVTKHDFDVIARTMGAASLIG